MKTIMVIDDDQQIRELVELSLKITLGLDGYRGDLGAACPGDFGSKTSRRHFTGLSHAGDEWPGDLEPDSTDSGISGYPRHCLYGGSSRFLIRIIFLRAYRACCSSRSLPDSLARRLADLL